MNWKNQISVLVFTLLIFGIFSLALPDAGNAIPVPLGDCCQFEPNECSDLDGGGDDGPIRACRIEDLRPGVCNESTGLCTMVRNVPTLSEWGLMTMAGVLGLVGFIAIRRRKVTA